MTRQEFDSALMTAPFSNGSLRLHDAEQRQIIDEQVEENRGLRRDVRLMQTAHAEQAQEITRLREALQLLYAVQNGCPLPTYQADFDRAIALTEQALKEHP